MSSDQATGACQILIGLSPTGFFFSYRMFWVISLRSSKENIYLMFKYFIIVVSNYKREHGKKTINISLCIFLFISCPFPE
jgi:hypothetical protein